MKLILFMTLSILISCGKSGGNGSSDGPESRKDPVCGEPSDGMSTVCLPNVDWTINSTSVNFPKKFRLLINGGLVTDTCLMPRGAALKESEGRRILIQMKYSWLPSSFFKLEIIDLGEDCTNNAIFHTQDEVQYGTAEIIINGVKSYNIYARLEN